MNQPEHLKAAANDKLLGSERSYRANLCTNFCCSSATDQMIKTESANIIYNTVESPIKKLKWYEESQHVITMDKEKDLLHEDIYSF